MNPAQVPPSGAGRGGGGDRPPSSLRGSMHPRGRVLLEAMALRVEGPCRSPRELSRAPESPKLQELVRAAILVLNEDSLLY